MSLLWEEKKQEQLTMAPLLDLFSHNFYGLGPIISNVQIQVLACFSFIHENGEIQWFSPYC